MPARRRRPAAASAPAASFAHFDADHPVPVAGCLSSFLVSVAAGALLLGRMREHEAWASLDAIASGKRAFAGWVLPAAHLRIGEDPEAAARRVAAEQLRATVRDLRLARVLSYAGPLEARRQALHWDLCFVYDADLEVRRTPAWFAELRRVPLTELTGGRFARGHGDVLADLGLLLDR